MKKAKNCKRYLYLSTLLFLAVFTFSCGRLSQRTANEMFLKLKGAFVELTSNKNPQNIFIAEGIETALSIAEAQPKAHVLCSLGVSNMHNIALNFKDTQKGKECSPGVSPVR